MQYQSEMKKLEVICRFLLRRYIALRYLFLLQEKSIAVHNRVIFTPVIGVDLRVMGRYTYLLQLQPSELPPLMEDHNVLFNLFFTDGKDTPDVICVDKAWDAIIHLLVGEPDTGQWRGEFLKMVHGKDISHEGSHGDEGLDYVLIHAEQVKEVDGLLAKVDSADLQSRFDPERMLALRIYPDIWDRGEDAFEYVYTHFRKLKAFYSEAAASSMAVITVTA